VPAPLRLAAAVWGFAWVLGGLVLGAIALSAMGVDLNGDYTLTIRQLTVTAVIAWATFAVALYLVSVRVGTGDLIEDYRVRFAPVDLLGIPAGIAAQLALVPAVYWPLQQLWPDTFSQERLEERAVELADRAGGAAAIMLVVVVVLGAPLFEELVYRGLLQRSLVATLGRWQGLIAAAVWFAVIHLTPVEYPGLFVAGLVFGLGVYLTDRLGPGMLAHAAFNATGIALAFSKT
jgi:membrane protease YdiL (CAAX protease family)